jgi:hypothetical protein
METDEFTQLQMLAESHELTQVPGTLLNSVRFEKPGLSIETSDSLNFTVVHATEHGSTQKEFPSLTEVADYLGNLHA